MRYIKTYTTTYGPWEDGADERERLSDHEEVWGCEPDAVDTEDGTTAVDIAVHYLTGRLFCTQPSSTGEWHDGMWYGAEPYEHPHNGTLEEVSAHLSEARESGFTDDERREIHRRITEA